MVGIVGACGRTSSPGIDARKSGDGVGPDATDIQADATPPSLEVGNGGIEVSPSDSLHAGLDLMPVDIAMPPDAVVPSTDGSMVPQDAESVGETVTSPDGSAENCIEQVLLYNVPGSNIVTVNSIAFSPDGQSLAAGISTEIVTWRLSDAVQVDYLTDLWAAGIFSVAYFPDGRTIAGIGWGEAITFWGNGARTPSGRLGSATSALFAISPDGQMVASALSQIELWDVASGTLVRSLSGHTGTFFNNTTAVTFSPDGLTLASGGVDSTVKLWDVASGAALAALSTGSSVPRGGVAISPDGKLVAALSASGLQLWSLLDYQSVATISVDPLATSFAFTPDGKSIVAGGSKVRVYSVSDGTLVYELGGATKLVAVSPDGTRAAATGDKGVPVHVYCLR